MKEKIKEWNNDVRLIDRFYGKFEITDTCWVWKGKKDKNGYGQFYMNLDKKEISVRPHRFSYMIFKGEIPDGLLICHSCDNPACVNPQHLFLGTQKINIQDALKKERMNGPKGTKQWLAKFKDDDIREIRKLKSSGMNGNQIAKKYNVNRRVIYDILKKITWKHVQD